MTLTAKQEKFCQCIADGMNQSDAYRAAYSAEKMKPDVVTVKASELASSGNVSVRLKELRDALSASLIWTREQSVEVLAEIARGSESRPGEKVSAVKELNSMHGFNEATKLDVEMKFPRVINVIAGRA